MPKTSVETTLLCKRPQGGSLFLLFLPRSEKGGSSKSKWCVRRKRSRKGPRPQKKKKQADFGPETNAPPALQPYIRGTGTDNWSGTDPCNRGVTKDNELPAGSTKDDNKKSRNMPTTTVFFFATTIRNSTMHVLRMYATETEETQDCVFLCTLCFYSHSTAN